VVMGNFGLGAFARKVEEGVEHAIARREATPPPSE
jgi:hypothetical protein